MLRKIINNVVIIINVHNFRAILNIRLIMKSLLIKGRRYLLSRIYPSTLWSSFPKRPQGLNVMLHLSPVLPQDDRLLTNSLSLFSFGKMRLSNINYPALLF